MFRVGVESHHAGGTGIFWGVTGEGSFHTPGSEGDLLSSVLLPPGVLFAWKQDTYRGPQIPSGHTLAQVHPALGVEQCLSWARPEADWLLRPPASLCPLPLSSPCPLHPPWTISFPLGQSIMCQGGACHRGALPRPPDWDRLSADMVPLRLIGVPPSLEAESGPLPA